MKIKLICHECGKEYKRKPSAVEGSKFCCTKCFGIYQSKNKCGLNNPNYKGGKISFVCGQCGNIFTDYPSKNRIFCCHDCYTLWQSENKHGKNTTNWNGGHITLICEWCGSEYTRNKSAIENSHFCCQDCYNKGQSADKRNIPYNKWESFASESLYCSLFNEKFKEKIREFYHRKCFICNKIEKNNNQKLSVHHVNYNKDCLCGTPCEFVPLCISCHAKTNHNRKYWEDLIMCYLQHERYYMIDL